jgi:hypothetical protein
MLRFSEIIFILSRTVVESCTGNFIIRHVSFRTLPYNYKFLEKTILYVERDFVSMPAHFKEHQI